MHFWIVLCAIVVLLVLLVQILARRELIAQSVRISIGVLLLIVALGIGVFTFFQDKNEAKYTQLAQAFLQGKTLICKVGTKDIAVSQKEFNFISGTLTLMGKRESKFLQTTIPLKACELDNAITH